jgi:hypothetical protein
VNLSLVAGDDIDAFEEYRLDRGLPGPKAERVVAERRVIGVEDQRVATAKVSGGVAASETRGIAATIAGVFRPIYQLAMEHDPIRELNATLSLTPGILR